jgi:PAS domain S-box-containing protein
MEVDLNEKILMVNQSFCDMSGYTQDELVGANTADFFKGKVIDKIIDEKKTLRNNKISDAYELEIINKNNLHKFWLVSGAPMYNDNGEQIGSIGIHLDITDRKDQEKKLEHALKSIQDVNQELNDFAYIVSHDLKAPLRGIGSLATWLEEDYKNKIDKEGQESLHLLVQRTQRMHNLIDGILNYSRVGRTSENIEKVETQNLVVKIIDLISPPSHIHISIDNKLPDVYFDEVKLQQVFQNLLSNAIKFSDKPTGEIIVKSKDDGNFIIFSVTDNGPGIDQNYFEKIFQMFQTLNSRDTFESTGIGLAIVKKIVENYGGKIWLNSKVNEGTTFYFSVKKNNV